jgi:hypothetical protein
MKRILMIVGIVFCLLSCTVAVDSEDDIPKAVKPFVTVVRAGQVWEYKSSDPFQKISKMKILRVKDGYCQYCYLPACGSPWSLPADFFVHSAKLIEEEKK